MTKISMLIPSKHPSKLSKLLDSISKQCENPEAIEVLVGVDIGDPYEAAGCRYFELPPTDPFSTNKAFNFLAKQARGDYFWILNDDAVILSPFVDSILRQPQGTFGVPDCKVLYSDGMEAGGEFDFPVLTRQASDLLGWVLPEEFICWGADVWLHEAYRSAGRIHRMPEIKLAHERTVDWEVAKNFGDWTGTMRQLDKRPVIEALISLSFSGKK